MAKFGQVAPRSVSSLATLPPTEQLAMSISLSVALAKILVVLGLQSAYGSCEKGVKLGGTYDRTIAGKA